MRCASFKGEEAFQLVIPHSHCSILFMAKTVCQSMKDTITDESCSSFSLCIRVDKARRGEALEPECLPHKSQGKEVDLILKPEVSKSRHA